MFNRFRRLLAAVWHECALCGTCYDDANDAAYCCT